MIYFLLKEYPNVMMACGFGAVAAYFLTIFGLKIGKDKLPADEGRDFAVDGKLSKGKPRGAGIDFIMSFIIVLDLHILRFEAAIFYRPSKISISLLSFVN